jgi:hypothetical protein
MVSRSRDNEATLAPTPGQAGTAYESDFYTWSQEQARLLRAGVWKAVDRENVAEEIESLGREQFNKLESALRVLLPHLLKWDHQPGKRTRSWALSVKDQRLAFGDVLADNPGLKSRLDEALARAYRRARIQAAAETGLPEEAFPESCPYGLDEVATRELTL